jgi:C1A family cysteine protease
MTTLDFPTWDEYKRQFQKVYSSNIEDFYRKHVYENNLLSIKNHNSQNTGYIIGVTKFSDETTEESLNLHTGLNSNTNNLNTKQQNIIEHKLESGITLPVSYDLRGTGYVSGVKYQGWCGSCWAFAAAGAIEGQTYKTFGRMISPSVEQLVDCVYANGCNGGYEPTAYDYVKNHGVVCEKKYGYTSKDTRKAPPCLYTDTMASIYTGNNSTSSFVSVADNNDEALMIAIYQNGPVAVDVCVNDLFMSYKATGSNPLNIYKNSPCFNNQLNHAVLAVGWGRDSINGDYWIIKNQYGTNWGYDGYIYIARGMSLIRMPTYPINLTLGPETDCFDNNAIPDWAWGLIWTSVSVIIIGLTILIIIFINKRNKSFNESFNDDNRINTKIIDKKPNITNYERLKSRVI